MLTVLRHSAQRATNHLQDLWLGISTTGTAPAELPGHVYYATVTYSCTRSVLRKLNLTEADTFADVGCGKGRVVCLAARHNIQRAIGIEYSSMRADVAKRNVTRLRGRRADAKILCQAAEETDYTDVTALYFFNPFEPPLLDSVLNKIRSDRQGRATRMAFVMESVGHREVFSLHEWLTCYERFEDGDKHIVAFYRTALVPQNNLWR